MPAKFPVIGFDPWKSEPERVERQARRARIRFLVGNFAKGLFWGLVIAAVFALILRISAPALLTI
jgi:tetrahydromethanopterin S-methyltransferase subunit B